MATGGREFRQSRKSFACFLLFIFISFVLQFAGLIAPGWFVADFGSSGSIDIGLFIHRVCDREGCRTGSLDKDNPRQDLINMLEEYRGETITALVTCFIAAVVTCRLHCVSAMEQSTRAIHLFILVVALGLSGSLSMAASGKWGRLLIENREEFSNSATLKPPYALILTGVGGMIAALLFLVITVNACIFYNKRNATPPNQQNQPVGQPYIVHAPQGQPTYAPPVYSTIVPSAPPLYNITDLHYNQGQQQHAQMYSQLELQQMQHQAQFR